MARKSNSQASKVCVLGGGSWGTAIAVLLARNGHTVTLWEYQENLAGKMKEERENKTFLPGVNLPENVGITSSLSDALSSGDYVIFVIPSHVFRSVAKQAASLSPDLSLGKKKIISAAKGIENDTLKRMSEIIKEEIPALPDNRLAVMSGPSFAAEVAREVPTAVVAASEDESYAREIQDLFMGPTFRVYINTDVAGVEFGGSFKNVMAIASGIVDGVGFGDNSKAALLTRGIAEMTRLGVKLGADTKTFAGLSGIGDLILTCMGKLSRNLHVGKELGKGRNLTDILGDMPNVAEGVKTAASVRQLAIREGVETPIMEKVYDMLFNDLDPKQAAIDLMTREPKTEH